MPDIGIIQEQGFVTGQNLGFKPLTESEKKKIEEEMKKKEKEDK